MKKLTVLQSVGVSLVVVLAGGCATGVRGPSDEELIDTLLKAWTTGIMEKDADKMLATYSEDFSHDGYDYEAADKEGLRKFLDYADEEGYLDEVDISFDGSETSIEGDTATISLIEYVNDQGAVTIELTATKGKAGWLFTDMYIEGL